MSIVKRSDDVGRAAKQALRLAVIVSAATLTACVAQREIVLRDCVGPAFTAQSGTGPKGFLVVFSAFDPSPNFSELPYRGCYTDFKLLSGQGTFLQKVHNQDDREPWQPKQLCLPAGLYQVLARANGHQQVNVPVRVVAGQLTPVYLEGGTGRRFGASTNQAQTVRLPDGQFVGWRDPELENQKSFGSRN